MSPSNSGLTCPQPGNLLWHGKPGFRKSPLTVAGLTRKETCAFEVGFGRFRTQSPLLVGAAEVE